MEYQTDIRTELQERIDEAEERLIGGMNSPHRRAFVMEIIEWMTLGAAIVRWTEGGTHPRVQALDAIRLDLHELIEKAEGKEKNGTVA